MEKQRDKAARRMQRKADRAAGITSDEPDDFGLADGEVLEGPEADGPDSEETQAN